MNFKLLNVSDFKEYINKLNIRRKIDVIQLHHTYSPSYANFTGSNHEQLQNNMRNYHVNTKGWRDIAQQFTIFPDGKIGTGRDINIAPAGIVGANSHGVCIEILGNFDVGGDVMTQAQKDSVVSVTRILLDRFNLNSENNVTYHCWWTANCTNLNDYVRGRSAKTCPGTAFFGGNTRFAYESNLKPLIDNLNSVGKESVMPQAKLTSANDITWELNHTYFPIDDMAGFVKVLDEAKNNNSPLYWGYYKLVNKIK